MKKALSLRSVVTTWDNGAANGLGAGGFDWNPCDILREFNEVATVALWATTIDALRTTRKMTIGRNFITMRV